MLFQLGTDIPALVPGKKINVLVLIALIATISCSTLEPFPVRTPTSVTEIVRVGDDIKITTRTGARFSAPASIRVTAIFSKILSSSASMTLRSNGFPMFRRLLHRLGASFTKSNWKTEPGWSWTRPRSTRRKQRFVKGTT